MEFVNEADRPYHAVAALFPPLEGEAYEQLKASIAEDGLRVPIVLHPDGSVLDGRNRHRVCLELGVPPKFETWDGQGSLVKYVIDLNMARRHLTSSQRAAIAVDALPLLEEEARESMRAAGEARSKQDRTQTGQFAPASPVNSLTGLAGASAEPGAAAPSDPNQTKAAQRAAELTGTNRTYVNDAKQLSLEAPELLDKVRTGELTLPKAQREHKRTRAAGQLNAIAIQNGNGVKGNYSTIVLDPPWSSEKSERDALPKGVDLDYPTLGLDQLRALKLPMGEACTVFIWCTQGHLPAALRLLKGWDLTYKCVFTWHKPDGFQPFGMPQFNSEFVVCGQRGTPQFEDTTGFAACFQAPAGPNGEKPAAFYDTLRRMTKGARLIVFGRYACDGFDPWDGASLPLSFGDVEQPDAPDAESASDDDERHVGAPEARADSVPEHEVEAQMLTLFDLPDAETGGRPDVPADADHAQDAAEMPGDEDSGMVFETLKQVKVFLAARNPIFRQGDGQPHDSNIHKAMLGLRWGYTPKDPPGLLKLARALEGWTCDRED